MGRISCPMIQANQKNNQASRCLFFTAQRDSCVKMSKPKTPMSFPREPTASLGNDMRFPGSLTASTTPEKPPSAPKRKPDRLPTTIIFPGRTVNFQGCSIEFQVFIVKVLKPLDFEDQLSREV